MKAYGHGILKKLPQRRKGAKKPSIQNTPHCLDNGVHFNTIIPSMRLCVFALIFLKSNDKKLTEDDPKDK